MSMNGIDPAESVYGGALYLSNRAWSADESVSSGAYAPFTTWLLWISRAVKER
jgi:hypothetical protein